MFAHSSIRVIAASLIATAAITSAIADVVYDDEMSAAPTGNVEVRNVINNTNMNDNTASTGPVIVESRMQKHSEKSRERRGFQENVNNELVIQRLEDRRLKQEEKLTAVINKRFTLEDDDSAGHAAPVMREEVIVRPIHEAGPNSYQMSAAPRATTAQRATAIGEDNIVVNQSSTNLSAAPVMGKSVSDGGSNGGISIMPRAGLSAIMNDYYDFKNQYVLGVGVGFDVSNNVSIEAGYAYSDYRVGLRNYGNYDGYSSNQLTFKNNTFDLGMKLYLSGLDAKVRPFVGGGMAYSMGFINYDRRTLGYYGNANTWGTEDYQLNQFQGILQAGVEFKISANASIGAVYKYLKPIASTESEEGLYNGSFYNYSGGGAPLDNNKQAVRGTLQDSDTQMILVNAAVTF